jgi:hypothetical protein
MGILRRLLELVGWPGFGENRGNVVDELADAKVDERTNFSNPWVAALDAFAPPPFDRDRRGPDGMLKRDMLANRPTPSVVESTTIQHWRCDRPDVHELFAVPVDEQVDEFAGDVESTLSLSKYLRRFSSLFQFYAQMLEVRGIVRGRVTAMVEMIDSGEFIDDRDEMEELLTSCGNVFKNNGLVSAEKWDGMVAEFFYWYDRRAPKIGKSS